jgi:hypothetical protein
MATDGGDDRLQPGVEPQGGSEALRPYLGRWIAMDDDRVIRASGRTFDEALAEADKVGVQDPEFLFVQAPGFVGHSDR